MSTISGNVQISYFLQRKQKYFFYSVKDGTGFEVDVKEKERFSQLITIKFSQ